MKQIKITYNKKSFIVLLDDSDYKKVNGYNWYFGSGYAQTRLEEKTVYMHRLITNAPKHLCVDHIDGNRLNNQKNNLRLCTRAENTRNSRKQKNNKNTYKGVTQFSNGKWRAQIWYENKIYQMGMYDTEVEAAIAYDKKAIELHKDFAHLNFPETVNR